MRVVTWDFNKNENTDLKQSDLQKKVGTLCMAEDTQSKTSEELT